MRMTSWKLMAMGCLLAAGAAAQEAGAPDAALDKSQKAIEAQQRALKESQKTSEAQQKTQQKAQDKALKDQEKMAADVQARVQERLAAARNREDLQAQMEKFGAAVYGSVPMALEDAQAAMALAQVGVGAGVGAGYGGGGPFGVAGAKFAQAARTDAMYQRGQSALDQHRWDEALTDFTQVASQGGDRADGALYWKAYTLNKLGWKDDALAAIADLRKSYASSRWLQDAGALEIEVKQSSGQPVSPEAQTDEDLKLMALNGLMQTDPDKALTAVDGILKGAQAPRLKGQALFVLAQNNSPKAQQMLEQVARGSGNPDLQVKAIGYLAPRGFGKRAGDQSQPNHGPLLAEIYGSTSDVSVKRAVINALAAGRDNDRLLELAKTEKSADLRADIIRRFVGTTVNGRGTDVLVSDTLANSMAQMYSTEQDKTVKRAIVDSFASRNQVKQMVAAARTEKDPEMVRYIVNRLSSMKSPEAADYLMEILKK